MFCIYCGSEVVGAGQFCATCGKAIDNGARSPIDNAQLSSPSFVDPNRAPKPQSEGSTANVGIPAVGLYAEENNKRRGGNQVLTILAIGFVFVAGVWAVSSAISVNNVGESQNSGSNEQNTNVYNEDDSYDGPSGHYEETCKTVRSGLMGLAGQPSSPNEWETICTSVWVED